MKSTDKRLSTTSNGGLKRWCEDLQTVQEQALATRNIQDALRAPTIHHVILQHGAPGALGAAGAIIHQGMDLFAQGRRLTSGMVGMVSEMMVTKYKHESLADLNVFLRKCAAGEYDEGKTYGSLDVPLIMGWFTRYLEEKAIVREQEAEREEHVIEQRMRKDIGNSQVLMDALKTSVDNWNLDTADRREAARRERLKRDLEFTDRLKSEDPANEEVQDVLVRLYQLHEKAGERNMILQECDRRGIDRFAFIERVKNAAPFTPVPLPHGTDQ